MTLGDLQILDRCLQWRWNLYCGDWKIHLRNGCKGWIILFFVWIENLLLLQNSGAKYITSFTKTNEQCLDDTHALWLWRAQVSSLPSGHIHFQTSSQKENQITITIIFELADWHGWQCLWWISFVTVLYFSTFSVLLEFYLWQSCPMFTDSFVHHHGEERHSVDGL